MESIDLLLFLKKKNGATVKEIMRQFDVSRTTILYHLDLLEKEELLATFQKGKATVYLPVSHKQLQAYYKKKLSSVQHELTKLTEDTPLKKNPNKKLTLCIANYYDLLPHAKQELEQYYDIQDYSTTQLYLTEEEFIKRTKDVDVILNNFACYITKETLARLPKLQYMHLSTYITRYVDIIACRDQGVRLSSLPHSYKSIAVTEFMLAQTFALLRQTIQASTQVQSGINEFRYFQGEQLRGKKAIIFGTDNATRKLIDQLRGLGVDATIYAGDTKEDPAFYGLSHFATKEEVFETGDIFYIAWVGAEYRPLVTKLSGEILDNIKRPTYIVSVYKHSHIDFSKIRELIYNGLIKGLALDYFPNIAIGDSRLTEAEHLFYLPNVIITPDIAWYTRDSVLNANRETNERLIAYAKGQYDYLLPEPV